MKQEWTKGGGDPSGRTEETRSGLPMDFLNIAEGWSFLLDHGWLHLRRFQDLLGLFRVLIRAQLFQVWQTLSFLTQLTANVSSKNGHTSGLVEVKIVTGGSWSHLQGNCDARCRYSIFRISSGVSSCLHNVPMSCWKASAGEPIRFAFHCLGPRILYRDEQATLAWKIPAVTCPV